MRLEHHLVGGYVRYSLHIIIIIIIIIGLFYFLSDYCLIFIILLYCISQFGFLLIQLDQFAYTFIIIY